MEIHNKYIVCAYRDGIAIMGGARTLAEPITKEDALNLAAWLVAVVGDKEKFDSLYEKVLNT